MSRAATLALLLMACQSDPDRPPRAPGCPLGTVCTPPGGVPGDGGSAAEAGAAGEGGEAGSAAGTAGKAGAGGSDSAPLTGTVRELRDDTFRQSVLFAGPAIVEAEATSGALVSASWNGAAPFSLTGFRDEAPIWLSVRPASNAALLRTLHSVRRGGSALELGLVRADVVDFILQLLTVPDERLPGRAQAVLRFTRQGTTQGLAGISVTLPAAASIVYAAQGSWTDVETETDASGLVLLANVAAAAFPGSARVVRVRGGTPATVEVRVAADAVSMLEVATTPP